MNALLQRYLFREAARTWVAVTIVLLAIMLATRLARFLSEAAKGNIDPSLLLVLVGLSSLRYLTILIPVSLLISVMLTLGKLYQDNEVAAMQAGGLGLGGLYRPFLRLGLMLALLGAVLSLWWSPLAGRTADFLVKEAASRMTFGLLEPGRFRALPDGRGTLYIEDYADDDGRLKQVFAQVRDSAGDSIVLAREGALSTDEQGRYQLLLQQGSRFERDAIRGDIRMMDFARHGVSIMPPAFVYNLSKTSLKPSLELWRSAQPEDRAELHWRLATPLSTWLLVLLAVPLARTSSRGGRYGRLGWGVLGFIIYFNTLGVGQAWLEAGQLPSSFGLWWVHAIVAAVGCAMWLRAGRYRQRLRRGLL